MLGKQKHINFYNLSNVPRKFHVDIRYLEIIVNYQIYPILCGWFVFTIDINYLQEMQNIWPHINELTELKSGAFCGQPGKHISNI